jgi:hypothetical protein
MQNIINIYKKHSESEFELRFGMNRNISLFKKILTGCLATEGNKTIEHSINFISPGQMIDSICKYIFLDGVKQNIVYYGKKQISKLNISDASIPYKATLSIEKPIQEFKVDIAKFARIKLRLTITPKELYGWKIDFTLVKLVTNIVATLKRDKEKMLYKISIDNFMNEAPWNWADQLEIEAEHIPSDSKDKNITPDDIARVVSFITNKGGGKISLASDATSPEYKEKLLKIANEILSEKAVADMKFPISLRNISNNVFELNKSDYFNKVFPRIDEYIILEKADGIRTLCIIEPHMSTTTGTTTGDTAESGTKLYALNNVLTIFSLDSVSKQLQGPTIFDCEYIPATNKYYIFDVIMFGGKNLALEDTARRISYIPQIVSICKSSTTTKDIFFDKKIVSLTKDNYSVEIKNMWEEKSPFDKDGIIFDPKKGSYMKRLVYKWKPISHMSIDFLVKKAPDSLIGIAPYTQRKGYTLCILFSGINKQLFDNLKLTYIHNYNKIFPVLANPNWFPIQFSPSDYPYAHIYYHPDDSKFTLDEICDKVCEFRLITSKTPIKQIGDIPDRYWEILKIRLDRLEETERGTYLGNYYYVAEFTWQNYTNPLELEDITIPQDQYISTGYFKEEKLEIYKLINGFHSFVKSELIKKFSGAEWLIDIGAGKGQDLFRVSDVNIKNALFLDIDIDALNELVLRKHNVKGQKSLNTKIFVKHMDVTTDYKNNISNLIQIGIPCGKINIIMCNFAFHYMVTNEGTVYNVVNFISSIIEKGGYFMFIGFNGAKVFNKLKEHPNGWDLRQGDVLKFSIRAKYTEDYLANTGQAIEVLLPFSKGEYYTEYLVNYDYIIDVMSKHGFSVDEQGDFVQFIDKFYKQSNRTKYVNVKELDPIDIEYTGLNSYIIFKKHGNTVKKTTSNRKK